MQRMAAPIAGENRINIGRSTHWRGYRMKENLYISCPVGGVLLGTRQIAANRRACSASMTDHLFTKQGTTLHRAHEATGHRAVMRSEANWSVSISNVGIAAYSSTAPRRKDSDRYVFVRLGTSRPNYRLNGVWQCAY